MKIAYFCKKNRKKHQLLLIINLKNPLLVHKPLPLLFFSKRVVMSGKMGEKDYVMKHLITILVALISLPATLFLNAQTITPGRFDVYGVAFYNQENLFDTIHDEGKDDVEFLPTGSYNWTEQKYKNKLHNMAYALSRIGMHEIPEGCAIIGLSEVENDRVLNDLISQPELSERGYRYIHIEGPDKRGVDCALLYKPEEFKVETVNLYPYVQELEKDSAFFTRGFLTVTGKLAGEEIGVIVCHWPSRGANAFYRMSGGRQTRAVKDRLLREHPGIKVLVMGDFNDDPMDDSMVKALGAKGEKWEVAENELYNPLYNYLDQLNAGTLLYRGKWNLFDQIVVTPNLIPEQILYDDQTKGVKVITDYSSLKLASARIGYRDYLITQKGSYKGSPHRTTGSKRRYLNGYSDHLPVVSFLIKERSPKSELK